MRTLGWAVAIAFVATTGIGAGHAQATLIFKLETVVEGASAPETEPAALESESNKEEGFEFTSFTDKHGRHEGGSEPDLLSSTSPEGKGVAADFAEWTQAGNHAHHGGSKKKGRGPQQGGGSGSGNRNSSGSGNSSTNGSSANGTGNAPSGGSNSGVNGSANGGSSNNGSSNGGSSNEGGSSSGSSNNGGSSGGTSGGGSNGDSSNGNSNGGSNGGGSSSGDGSSGGGSESSSSSSDGGSPAFNNPPPSDLGNSPLEYVPDSLPPAVNIAAVPEPSTLLMGGLALIGFGLARFRGSKKN